MKIRIGSHQELTEAMRLNSWLHRPVLRSLELAVPGLDEPRKRRLESRLRHLFNECGCGWAAIVLVIALVAGFALYPGFTWPGSMIIVLGSIAVSFTAKLVSLYSSHRSLGRELTLLTEYLEE